MTHLECVDTPASCCLARAVVFKFPKGRECGGPPSFVIQSFAILRVNTFTVRVCALQTQRVRQVRRCSHSRQYMGRIPAGCSEPSGSSSKTDGNVRPPTGSVGTLAFCAVHLRRSMRKVWVRTVRGRPSLHRVLQALFRRLARCSHKARVTYVPLPAYLSAAFPERPTSLRPGAL